MSLLESTRELVREVATALDGSPSASIARAIEIRLGEPLRVAIAGTVKAGKSTLLNALVGEELAPTDAGECTKVVTWYREGLTYKARIQPLGGAAFDTSLQRTSGAVEVDLKGMKADDIEQIEIEWPSAALRTMTLIDTPGLASLSSDISARSTAFLAPEDEEPTPADAVLYLMRRAHPSDARFLEAFHDDDAARATAVNAIGVLARADEVGGGRLDSLESARLMADRWRAQPQLRRFVQTVVPVAGLLGATGTMLTEREFRALGQIAEAPEQIRTLLLLTADRFSTLEDGVPVSVDDRRYLLSRFGLFGVRLSVSLIRDGTVTNASGLAMELVQRSGLAELREVLATQLSDRRDTLKARSVLLAIEPLINALPGAEGERLAGQLERILAGAHELAELRLLAVLRSGRLESIGADDATVVERLLGVHGAAPAARAGLPPAAPVEEIRRVLLEALATWRGRAESPLATRADVEASTIIARSCEGGLNQIRLEMAESSSD